MSTYKAEPFKVGHREGWRVKCSSPGHPPHFIEDGFKTAAEAQVRADSLTALDALENIEDF